MQTACWLHTNVFKNKGMNPSPTYNPLVKYLDKLALPLGMIMNDGEVYTWVITSPINNLICQETMYLRLVRLFGEKTP